MYLIQILVASTTFLVLYADDSATRGVMSEADILKTVFYGSEDALRGTLEDIEVGSATDDDEGSNDQIQGTFAWPGGQEYSRVTRMGMICENLAQAPSSATVKSIAYKLDRIQPPEMKRKVMLSLEAKKVEMRVCCSKDPSERYECMDQARRQRYDRICSGEPPCPWALLKGRHPDVSKVTQRCCELEGVARYRCFLTSRLDHRCYRRQRRVA